MSKTNPGPGRKKLTLQPTSNASKALDLKPGTIAVLVSDIKLRKDKDTRPLSAEHVVSLAESISVLELLEPIVIDTKGHLLAGGHRLAALQLLAIEDQEERKGEFFKRLEMAVPASEEFARTPEKQKEEIKLANRLLALSYDNFIEKYPEAAIPVLVVDVFGQDKKDFALAVEMAENSHRRPYTKEEVEALAKRLEAAGYKKIAGRPAKGEVSMMTALEAALGRSKRHIHRILKLESTRKSSKTPQTKAETDFYRAVKNVLKFGEDIKGEDAKELVRLAKTLLAAQKAQKEQDKKDRQSTKKTGNKSGKSKK